MLGMILQNGLFPSPNGDEAYPIFFLLFFPEYYYQNSKYVKLPACGSLFNADHIPLFLSHFPVPSNLIEDFDNLS